MNHDPNSISLDQVAEVKRRQRENKIRTYYPDHGPLRRELYVKHMEFFRAGRRYRERECVAGNRCATPWAPIEMGHATRQLGEMLGAGAFDIRSWDGGSRCTRKASPVFLRGIEPTFLLHLDNGQVFQCSDKHRVLTASGYLAIDQLILHAGGLHCWRTNSDSRASYGTDNHPRGRQLLLDQDSGQEQPPSPSDAPRRCLTIVELADAGEPIPAHIRAFQELCLPSNPDDPTQIAALCAQFEDPTSSVSDLWSTPVRRELLRFAHELRLERVAHPCPDSETFFSQSRAEDECLSANNSSSESRGSLQWHALSGVRCALVESGAKFLHGSPRTEIFFPLDFPRLIGGNSIVSIVPLGFQPILDVEVEGSHCYESQGIIHHNCGKSEGIGGYETVLHLTGRYPDWWPGQRFDHSIHAWAAGDTSKTVLDIIQTKLLGKPGDPGDFGTGLIPKDLIQRTTPRPGVPDGIETIAVKHVSGRYSTLLLKSFDQKREAFQGTEIDWIWLDEEPPKSIWIECLTRTMATGAFKGGWFCMTYTPIQGWTDVTEELLDDKANEAANRFVMTMTWEDAPHLPLAEREALAAKYPPNERQARMRGIPELGSGAIYPFPDEDVVVAPFAIPRHWPRGFGLDVGDKTAAMFIAHDTDTDIAYFIQEYYRSGQDADASTHAAAIGSIIRAQGFKNPSDMPGWIDPSARQVSQTDRLRLMDEYRKHGLNVMLADNSVAAGLLHLHDRFSQGRLKIFANCVGFNDERKKYRRDEQGRVIKRNDHRLDAGRYGVFTGLGRMSYPTEGGMMNLDELLMQQGHDIPRGPLAWMS